MSLKLMTISRDSYIYMTISSQEITFEFVLKAADTDMTLLQANNKSQAYTALFYVEEL